ISPMASMASETRQERVRTSVTLAEGTPTVDGQHGKNSWWVDLQFECVDPDESDGRRSLNGGSIDIASGTCNNATNDQPDNDTRILKEWGSKKFNELQIC
ncbi:4625_t:CDS:1, partial [Acaulospora colombiana]